MMQNSKNWSPLDEGIVGTPVQLISQRAPLISQISACNIENQELQPF